ncbi:MAG TPA: ATP-grasp domain-containing protein, partial [Candidatus Dormibacteraeota bacterium]|nr:ATP-grasp domain-containing protein [Candidatus Dormibacteraeota bacterium]
LSVELEDRDFVPVIFGSDINTYSMARAFHEAYRVKSTVVGKYAGGPSFASRIVDFLARETIESDATFREVVNGLATANAPKKLLLLGCGDSYVELISKFRDEFPANVIAPVVAHEQLLELIRKDRFYAACRENGIPYPATFVYERHAGHDYSLGFDFPAIVKPANGTSWWEHPFTGQKKAHRVATRDELDQLIDRIYEAGYTDSLILQEFIPGDDSHMRVLTCYSDQNGKVTLAALGHVLLEEHTPKGIGNHAAILTGAQAPIVKVLTGFLEKIGYMGFSNFDIKHDARDGTDRVFELNARQGRSNFYVTGSGYNLARYLVEDRLRGQSQGFTLATNEVLWLVIPMRVALTYVTDESLRSRMRTLDRRGKVVNPLFYGGDYRPRRFASIMRSHLSHAGKFRQYYRPGAV